MDPGIRNDSKGPVSYPPVPPGTPFRRPSAEAWPVKIEASPVTPLEKRASLLSQLGNVIQAVINTVRDAVSRIFVKKEYEVVGSASSQSVEWNDWGGEFKWGEGLPPPAEQKASEISASPGETLTITVGDQQAVVSSVVNADFERRAYRLGKGSEPQPRVQPLIDRLSRGLDEIGYTGTPKRKAEAIAETLTVMAQNYGVATQFAVAQTYARIPGEPEDKRGKYFEITTDVDRQGNSRVEITAYMTWETHDLMDNRVIAHVETARSFTIDQAGVLSPGKLIMKELL